MVQNLTDFAEGVKANPPEKFEAELWRTPLTENENFPKWFQKSHVVDEDGRPLIVYHGTPYGGFDSFDISRAGTRGTFESARAGVYFTANPDYANGLARSTREVAPAVYPAYLSIQNPLRVFSTEIDNAAEVDAMILQAKEGGHDGIIDEYNNFVVFDPKQIKSAIGNSGRFDPTSASLTDPIPVTAKEPAANVPPPQELGTQAREAPAPEGQAQGKAAEGQADPALMQSVRTRADEVATTAPDLVVGLAEDGSPITAKDALERIRREAQNGTDDELGAIDAPLVKIAMECALRFGE
jgi:hypothetical protein